MFRNIRQTRYKKKKNEKFKVVKPHYFVPSFIKNFPKNPGNVYNYVHRQHRRNARTLHGILFCHSCGDFLFPVKHFP